MSQTAVLGGGLSGLSAAYYLLQHTPSASVVIVEATQRLGGWIKSSTQNDGVVFEQGPRTIRPRGVSGANTLVLVEELQLADKVLAITTNHPAATKRMIFANAELHPLPVTFKSLFVRRKPFSRSMIRYLMKDIQTRAKIAPNHDESIYDFATRRFGKEVGDYLIAPMICGICGGDAKRISVKFLMESLFDKEQKYGSITRGVLATLFESKPPQTAQMSNLQERAVRENWSIYYFQGGIEVLPRRLEEVCRAKGARIELNSKCTSLDLQPGRTRLELNNGLKIESEQVISSIPAKELSLLVVKQHPHLANALNRIETVSLAVVNLQYNEHLLSHEAFGFLVCPSENRPVLGVIYDSCCFSYSDKTVLTVMMGGHWFYKYFTDTTSETDFLHTAMQQVGDILKIHRQPDNYKVNLLRNAIPQHTVGHKANLQRIDDYIRTHRLRLALCGCSYHGVGINDVIMSAKHVVNV